MVDPSAISALEQAAVHLDRMLGAWIQSRAADLESAPKSDPREFFNYGIHTLWRMVAIHKSIEHLKTPPAPPADPAPPTSAPVSSGTPMASGPGTPISVSASESHNSALRTPHSALDSLRTPHSALEKSPHSALVTPSVALDPLTTHHSPLVTPSVALDPLTTHHSPLVTPSVVPCVPSVPLLRSLTSTEAIAARIERLSAELTARIEAEPDSAPERTAAVAAEADQLGLKFLDTITRRDKYPGSGKFLNSIRVDLAKSPP